MKLNEDKEYSTIREELFDKYKVGIKEYFNDMYRQKIIFECFAYSMLEKEKINIDDINFHQARFSELMIKNGMRYFKKIKISNSVIKKKRPKKYNTKRHKANREPVADYSIICKINFDKGRK